MKTNEIKEKAKKMVAAENTMLAQKAAVAAAQNKARRVAANGVKTVTPLTPAQQQLITAEYTYISKKSGKPVTITGYAYMQLVTRNVCNNMGNCHMLHTAYSVGAVALCAAAGSYTPQKGTTFLQWAGVVVARKVSNFCRAQVAPIAAPGSVQHATTAGPLQALILKENINALSNHARRVVNSILAAPGAFLALGATPHLRRGALALVLAKAGYTTRQIKETISACKAICQ